MTSPIKTVHGGTRLALDAVEGITTAVERMHSAIARGPLSNHAVDNEHSRAPGIITPTVYALIRGVNGVLRTGMDQSVRLLPKAGPAAQESPASIRTIAAVNGVIGDHLDDTDNPLATSMQLMTPAQTLNLEPEALAAQIGTGSPHLVILVHGLCLSEQCWAGKGGPDIGRRLHQELACTPLYLRYNTGRHISSNGREFAELLQRLCEAWPVAVESVSLIGHSMGGLVIRSACWYAEQDQSSWLAQLQRVVCMGTPHHGSPLERAGHALDRLMHKTRYTAPLAFGKQRSAGIKDLRHGNLLDEDWQGHHPIHTREDTRRVVPLPAGVDHFFIAATVGRHQDDPLGQVLGDLLVRLDSAVGSHSDELRQLPVNPDHCRVVHEKHHFDLLDDERVHQQVIDWFSIH